MEQQPTAQTLKKPVTFGGSILIFLYNSITVAFYTLIPFMLGTFIISMTKYTDATLSGDTTTIFEYWASSLPVMIFSLSISAINLSLTVIAIFQDLVKNFQVDKNNYKKIFVYMTILFLIRILTDFTLFYIGLSLLMVGLLYWLLDKKFNKSQAILEKKVLNWKTITVLSISIFVLTQVILYFV